MYSANSAGANCKHDIAARLMVRRWVVYNISGLQGNEQAHGLQYRARRFIEYPCALSNHC